MSRATAQARRGDANPFGRAAGTGGVRGAHLLSTQAPQHVRQAMEQQDDDLDEVSNVLRDLGGIADTMGETVARQTEQAAHITHSVDDAQAHLDNSSRRGQRMLNS